ncbi:hypothetical protein [Hydrogenophaga sp.]|uniref:hypothetical protein n=1 Tax=Hydrogenophaga sp. TaxID=1904254 RepID=UPI002FC9EC98
MTILNLHIEQRRVLIASNTEATLINGNVGTMSKLFPIPHANAVVVGRGLVHFIFQVFMDCCLRGVDFDGTVKAFPQIAAARLVDLHAEIKKARVDVPTNLYIVLVGWSTARQEMVPQLAI